MQIEPKFEDIWRDWHKYLVEWTRDRAPKLIVILVVAFIFVRLLGMITRRASAWSEKRPHLGAARAQQARTVIKVVHSTGCF